MLVKLFILHKDLHSVAVKPEDVDSEFEFIQGNDLYMEPADDAVRRIAKNAIGEQIGDSEFKLVRRESTTVINNGTCSVDSVAVYVHECKYGEVELRNTGYDWIPVSRVISSLCDCGKYFEAAYLDEACKVV